MIVVEKLPADTENGTVVGTGDVIAIVPAPPVVPLSEPSIATTNGVTVVRPVPWITKLSTVPVQGAEPQVTELLVTNAVDPLNDVLIVAVNGGPGTGVAVNEVIVAPEAVSAAIKIQLEASEIFKMLSSVSAEVARFSITRNTPDSLPEPHS